MTSTEIDEDIYRQSALSIKEGGVALFALWLAAIEDGRVPVPQEATYHQKTTKKRFLKIAHQAIRDWLEANVPSEEQVVVE